MWPKIHWNEPLLALLLVTSSLLNCTWVISVHFPTCYFPCALMSYDQLLPQTRTASLMLMTLPRFIIEHSFLHPVPASATTIWSQRKNSAYSLSTLSYMLVGYFSLIPHSTPPNPQLQRELNFVICLLKKQGNIREPITTHNHHLNISYKSRTNEFYPHKKAKRRAVNHATHFPYTTMDSNEQKRHDIAKCPESCFLMNAHFLLNN